MSSAAALDGPMFNGGQGKMGNDASALFLDSPSSRPSH